MTDLADDLNVYNFDRFLPETKKININITIITGVTFNLIRGR